MSSTSAPAAATTSGQGSASRLASPHSTSTNRSSLSPSKRQSTSQATSMAISPSSGADTEDDFDEADGEDEEEGEEVDHGGNAGDQLRNETSVKSGYLYKRGEKRKNWKKRWFVLRSSKLCYYKNEKEYQLLRFIDIEDVHTIASIELKRIEHSFGIVTSTRQYYVRASSKAEKESWIKALNEVKEQIRQRSTLTQELSTEDLDDAAPTPTRASSRRGAGAGGSLSASSAPSAASSSSVSTATAKPITVTIPGQGQYHAPAQPRAIPRAAGGDSFSPLTSTSLSNSNSEPEAEMASLRLDASGGAEQFGLSYASQSSAGPSLGSSPQSRGLGMRRSPSPSGDASQGAEGSLGRKSGQKLGDAPNEKDASALRQSMEQTTGWTFGGTSDGGNVPGGGTTGAALSSSEEDEDPEDWDEEERADQAMPLPGTSLSPPNAPHGTNASTSSNTTPPASSMPKQPQRSATADFLKDPNKVIHQGYLMKQSSRRKVWRKRWFVLTSSKLMYARSHMDAKSHRQIPLSSILDAIEYTSKKQPILTIPPGPQSPGPHSPSAISFQLGHGNQDAPERREASGGAPVGGGSGFSASSERSTHGPAKAAAAPGATQAGGAIANPSGAPADTATSATSATHGGGTAPERTASSVVATAAGMASNMSANLTGGVGSTGSQKRKKENCFKIITPKRTFVVGAPTEEEEIKWLSALQALLTRSREAQNPSSVKATSSTSASISKSQGDKLAGSVANDGDRR
ncbi:PH domain-like protein [Ceraceosorus guamensis]|uniref:PH domain-like protein n=1 Tax=Ceraceosorus guamensis TaxID=1522189 RepID=A0A316W264_9BASI|nr:PH domain-like protein [Ceraceosorus guamensis]PWN43614.1 PH domain-like protein [Ceraceosorus guamensis]